MCAPSRFDLACKQSADNSRTDATQQTMSSSPALSIQLSELTQVSREDLKPYCLALATPAKTHYLALRSDEELYSWLDDIYSRSPLMGVSNPTNFVHQVHVGFDPVSGAFTGLPEQWTRLLTSSAITKEDYARNPQAVLDVLEFYTDIQKRDRDVYGGSTGGPRTDARHELSMAPRPAPPPPSTAPARFGAGTGFAGQHSGAHEGDAPLRPAPAPPARSGPLPERAPPPPTAPRPQGVEPARAMDSARSTRPRPNMAPGRSAPAVPTAVQPSPSSSGPPHLKPLNLASGSRVEMKRSPSDSATTAPASTLPQVQSHCHAGREPTLAPRTVEQNVAATADKLTGRTADAPPATSAPPPQERRISKMTETQIMAKLKSVCSPVDPNTLYAKSKKIGQGASGSVYVARVLASGDKVAIKQMDLSAQPRKELIVNEILVMRESQHPNIVNFLSSFLVKGTELWVVMEYMEGGALTDIIDSNTLSEEQISAISGEVSPGSPPQVQALTDVGADLPRARASARPQHHPSRHQERQRAAGCPGSCQDQ